MSEKLHNDLEHTKEQLFP